MRHRRIALATVTAVAAAVALAGCSGAPSAGGTSDASPKTVTMWIYPVINDEKAHQAYWDNVVKSFEAKHKNITVEYEIYPWANRDQSLATAIAGGKGPDLVYMVPDQLPAYADSIEPMDAYLPASQKSDILDNVVKSISIDGHLMGVPILTSAYPLLCDTKAFEAAGVTKYPKTWEDLMDLAPKFQEKGIYVTNYYGSPEATLNMSFYPMLWQAGGSVFNKDATKIAFNSAAGVKALQYLADLAKNGYIEKDLISTSPPTEQTAAASNKVACTWQLSTVDVEPYWGKDAIRVLPPLTDKKSVSYGTVGSLSMLKGSKSKKAAGEFAAFATNAKNASAYDVASGYFSPLKSSKGLYPDNPLLSAVEATIPSATVGELNPKSREVMGVLAPEIQAAMLGSKTPKQALDAAASAAQQLLN